MSLIHLLDNDLQVVSLGLEITKDAGNLFFLVNNLDRLGIRVVVDSNWARDVCSPRSVRDKHTVKD